MGGKLFITILGLLLVQALGAIFFGMVHGAAFELVAAVIFLVAAIFYLVRKLQLDKYWAIPALLGFAFGFIHIVYLSFISVSLWLVILLCLNAAGFVLSLDKLAVKQRPLPLPVHARKNVLDKELPKKEKAKVTVYTVTPAKKKSLKRVTKKKVTKKSAKKKAVTKKVAKKPLRKLAKKKVVKKATKKSVRKAAKK